MWTDSGPISKNVSVQNQGPRPLLPHWHCSERLVTCLLKPIFRTKFSTVKNVLSSNLHCLTVLAYWPTKFKTEKWEYSSSLSLAAAVVWQRLSEFAKFCVACSDKTDLQNDSLLQVQEGPETDCRWALKAFTKGDKAYFVHSEGVW